MTGVIKPDPAEIEYKGMRFLITDRPNDVSMDKYIKNLQKHHARDVVRVCEPSYKTKQLDDAGIAVLDLPFDDGTAPPPEVVEQFFTLLKSRFAADPGCCIAVHCVAGLGRAPVLVALALIELGMRYEDAVELIRRKRRGAINSLQLSYLAKYRRKSRLKVKSHQQSCCVM